MRVKDLIADKKKVDEGCLHERYNGTKVTLSCKQILGELCSLCKGKSETLAKGISVATKLIEDEIEFLERFDLNDLDSIEMVVETAEDLENENIWADKIVQDRIKYLKSLLATESATEQK